MLHLQYTKDSSSSGGANRWAGEFVAEEWNVDPLDKMGYETFLRHLAQTHGAAYLCRPDGEPLRGVPDRVLTAQPAPVSVRKVNPRQLPKGVYTGSGYDDTHLEQKPEQQGHRAQNSYRTEVLKAVRLRPMNLQEICDATGIKRDTVKNILWRFKGTYFRLGEGRRWCEVQNVAG